MVLLACGGSAAFAAFVLNNNKGEFSCEMDQDCMHASSAVLTASGWNAAQQTPLVR